MWQRHKRFNNCHYIGSIKSREEIAKYYRSCNLLLFPAKDDCSPNVILEAMASGLPVVTLNSGGNLEIIQKGQLKGGVILDEKNPILSLKTIIDNYQNFQKDTLKIIKEYHDISITTEKYKKEILNLVSKMIIFKKTKKNLVELITYFKNRNNPFGLKTAARKMNI